VAVRVGFDDNRTLGDKETGGRVALPIFREIMLRVYADRLAGPVPVFPRDIEDGISTYLARGTAPPPVENVPFIAPAVVSDTLSAPHP